MKCFYSKIHCRKYRQCAYYIICPDCNSQLDEDGVCGFCSIPDICPYCGGYTNDWGWCLKDCQGTNKYE